MTITLVAALCLASPALAAPEALGIEADRAPWAPTFTSANPEDAAIARIAWEAAWECTGRLGAAHPEIAMSRRAIPGGLLGMAHWDADGVFEIQLDPQPGRLEEVIVHEVAHAWVHEGPPALVEGRTELLADCIVNQRDGLAALQWDDGRELGNLPDLKRWSNDEDHGPAMLADSRTDAYLGAARMMRVASMVVEPKALWAPELRTWEDFRALLATSKRAAPLLYALDGGAGDQRVALSDADLDGLPLIAEQLAGTDPNAWDSDGDGWWDGEALGMPRLAVAVPFDGSPVCTGLVSAPDAPARAVMGGNLRGEGRLELKLRRTLPGSPLVVEMVGTPNRMTGGLWAAVEGTHLSRNTDCVDADHGTVWAADPQFADTIPAFVMALHEVATRAEGRWGPTTRRMGVALGAPQTGIDGQVVGLSATDLKQALAHDKLEELATLAVALHRVWDNGTRQWPVATAMARSLTDDTDAK